MFLIFASLEKNQKKGSFPLFFTNFLKHSSLLGLMVCFSFIFFDPLIIFHLYLVFSLFSKFIHNFSGKEVTLSLPGSEGKLTLHILIKVVLSQEEKDRECAKMDAQRIEQEELQER